MASIIGQTSKAGRPNNTGEECQDIDWDNLPQPAPNQKMQPQAMAPAKLKGEIVVPSDPLGSQLVEDGSDFSQIAALEVDQDMGGGVEDQDEGRDVGGSQVYGDKKNESNSNTNKSGDIKKQGLPKRR